MRTLGQYIVSKDVSLLRLSAEKLLRLSIWMCMEEMYVICHRMRTLGQYIVSKDVRCSGCQPKSFYVYPFGCAWRKCTKKTTIIPPDSSTPAIVVYIKFDLSLRQTWLALVSLGILNGIIAIISILLSLTPLLLTLCSVVLDRAQRVQSDPVSLRPA